ncbi:uncharacterized protein LOC122026615 [Zingiber officinale]|uniref:uncharacterized protein LOC122026615 n=1 Tax=Zingiber officinale TaxID=94328 RepID=UPI001C4AFF4F|nr:uncharacterized protein LOC122026615 [Zingiber officinale]
MRTDLLRPRPLRPLRPSLHDKKNTCLAQKKRSPLLPPKKPSSPLRFFSSRRRRAPLRFSSRRQPSSFSASSSRAYLAIPSSPPIPSVPPAPACPLRPSKCLLLFARRFKVIIMEGESTSSRRLNFDESIEEYSEANQGCGDYEVNVEKKADEGNEDDIEISPPLSTDELVPKIGMKFQTEEEAYDFYLKYAKQVGFGIRRTRTHNDNSGRLIDRTFCCSAQGKRERTNEIFM